MASPVCPNVPVYCASERMTYLPGASREKPRKPTDMLVTPVMHKQNICEACWNPPPLRVTQPTGGWVSSSGWMHIEARELIRSDTIHSMSTSSPPFGSESSVSPSYVRTPDMVTGSIVSCIAGG